MTIKLYGGKSDRWGFEAAYCHYDYSLTFMILHWYLIVEFRRERATKVNY